jgi:tetratricopeptide (TPR) repeat protein
MEAIPHLKRAIELDPNFALAQALLSGVYANTGQSALAPEWSRKAYELRDRVSERERYFISWRYFRDATQAWDSALELARAWTAAYPRESFSFKTLGSAAPSLGQKQPAIAPLRESIRLDPRFISPTANLVGTLIALNQFDEARQALDTARGGGLDHIALRQQAYILAFINDDLPGIARELAAALAKPDVPLAFNWQPRISAFGGEVEKAHAEFRRSASATSAGLMAELSGLYSAQDAMTHAMVGQCREARTEAVEAIRLSRDSFTLESAGTALAWCGSEAEAAKVAGELSRRFPDAILTTHVVLPVMAAATAVRAGNPSHALELLEPVRRFDHAPVAEYWPAYLRGHAQLQLRHGAEAAAEFRSIIEHRGEQPDSPLYPLAHLNLARALVLSGDAAAARQAYLAFFELWQNADGHLLPLQEARREFDRVRH